MAIITLSFLPTRWGWNQIIHEAAFWKSVKGCTNIQVKDEGNSKQIRRGKVVDLSLGCNWNFPQEFSLQRTSWVSYTQSPVKKSFNPETQQHYSQIRLPCDLLSRKSQPQTGHCGKPYCIFSPVRAVPLVIRELPDRPGQGLLFHLRVRKRTKQPISSAWQAVEASSVDMCKLVHTPSDQFIKIICVLNCQPHSEKFCFGKLTSKFLAILKSLPGRRSCSKHFNYSLFVLTLKYWLQDKEKLYFLSRCPYWDGFMILTVFPSMVTCYNMGGKDTVISLESETAL